MDIQEIIKDCDELWTDMAKHFGGALLFLIAMITWPWE